jgi:nitrogen fixation protein FixH
MTGRRVALYFTLFFGAIAAVNALMITLAVRTHSGVVTEHPYEKGLAYNAVVKAEEQQEALGWKSRIEYANGALNFTLRDKKNQKLMPEKATATITRPTQKGLDFTAELQDESTPVSFPAHGLWEVRVDAVYSGVHYQQMKRIVVP